MRFRTLTAQREASCRGQAGQPDNGSRSDTWPYSNVMAHCDLNGEAPCCEQSPAGAPNRQAPGRRKMEAERTEEGGKKSNRTGVGTISLKMLCHCWLSLKQTAHIKDAERAENIWESTSAASMPGTVALVASQECVQEDNSGAGGNIFTGLIRAHLQTRSLVSSCSHLERNQHILNGRLEEFKRIFTLSIPPLSLGWAQGGRGHGATTDK